LKRNVKQLIALTVIFMLVFALAACGAQTPTKQGVGGAAPKDSAPTKKADNFPAKPINLVIPFGPGAAGDIFSRTFAKVAEKYFGQPIIPINKEGGSLAVGISYALSQPADGYNFVMGSSTIVYTIAAGQAPFKATDLLPLGTLKADYQVMAVKKDSQFKTFDDVVKYAKANPGKLKVGGSSTKSVNHVFALKIFEGAGIKASYIPYDAGNKTLLALLGGNIDAALSSANVVNQQVDSGDLRLLAVTSSKRVPDRPDVPTFKELGLTNIEDLLNWNGFFIKPGTPQEIVDKYNKVFEQVLNDPEWKDYLKKDKQMDFYKNSADFNKFFNNEVSDGMKLFKDLPQ
jgi:putative tricarboxylic transport membrane protein